MERMNQRRRLTISVGSMKNKHGRRQSMMMRSNKDKLHKMYKQKIVGQSMARTVFETMAIETESEQSTAAIADKLCESLAPDNPP